MTSISCFNKRDWYLAHISDQRDIEANGAKQALMLNTHNMKLQGDVLPKDETKKLSYETITPQDVFVNSPHILIAASTGSGKSVFTRWILNAFLYEEAQLLIDPHATKGKKVSSMEEGINLLAQLRNGEINKLVVGYGRDYESIANIYQALGDDNSGELAYRFSHGAEEANHRPLNIIIEELPSIIFGVDQIEKGLVAKVNQKCLLESRKVNLRLISIVQGDQVKLWGGQGASSLKSGYTHIRLGLEAMRYAAQQNQGDLEEVLTKDFQASLALHSKLQKGKTHKQMFRGTCWTCDGKYLPFKDVSAYNLPIESDLLDPQFLTDEGQDSTDSLGGVSDRVTVTPETQTPISQAENPLNDCETLVTPYHPYSVTRPDHDYSPPPSHYLRQGLTPPTWPQSSTPKTEQKDSGYHVPQVKNDGAIETKVVIENLESFWVRKYKDHPHCEALENIRPKFIQDRHLERYAQLRGDGDSASKACKTIFGGGKYSQANKWLKEVYETITKLEN
jgi:hypothetical protein